MSAQTPTVISDRSDVLAQLRKRGTIPVTDSNLAAVLTLMRDGMVTRRLGGSCELTRAGQAHAERMAGEGPRPVVIELPHAIAEDALISQLEQGELGGRRYRARAAVDAAIRDALAGWGGEN